MNKKLLVAFVTGAMVLMAIAPVFGNSSRESKMSEMQTQPAGLSREALAKIGVEAVTDKPRMGINEYRLKKNGLQILLVENHATPTVATTLVYHVGSRNEAVGYTGSTHFLEHMMFKGTPRHDPLKNTGIDQILKKVGGMNNATTWFDRTNYFEVVPAQHLDLCLDIESDRMKNLLLRQADRDAEMTVVRNELERGEDDPDDLLETNLFATAFREHPYHHPTIGWRSDVEGVPLARLRKFYEDFYFPDNATLIVIGDIDQASALASIAKFFSGIAPSTGGYPQVYTTEPPQEGERRFTVKRGTDVPRLVVGYRAPQCISDDTYALDVAETILGDSSKRSSRLYRELIGKGLASSTDCTNYSLRDPGLFVVSAQSAAGTPLEKLESVIKEQIKKMSEEDVTDLELSKAKKSISKSLRLGITDPLGFSMHLTEAIASADWKWWLDYPNKVEKVTKEEIKAVMKKYFHDDNRTVGYYYPRPDNAPPLVHTTAEPDTEKKAEKPAEQSEPASETKSEPESTSEPIAAVKIKLADRVVKKVMDNGLTVLTLPLPGSSTVAVAGKVKAGDQFVDKDKIQVASLVASMLTSGSGKYTKESLADELENMGTHLDVHGSTFWAEFNTEVVSEDLDKLMELVSDILINPKFPEKELQIEKKLRASDLEESKADTGEVAWNSLVRKLYKPGSVFYEKTFDEQLAELPAIAREDLKAFHDRRYTPDQTIVAFVGDITPERAEALCREAFGTWKKGEPESWEMSEKDISPVEAPEKIISQLPGKANADVHIGRALPVSFHTSDYFATVIANAALGYDSFACRLAPVRDKYGLTYGIYSVIDDPTVRFGPWFIKYSVNPENLDRAQEIVSSIVADYVKNGITTSELETEKAHLAGVFSVQLRSPRRIAERLALYEVTGMGASYMDNYPENLARVTKEDVDRAIRSYLDISKGSVISVSGTLDEKSK